MRRRITNDEQKRLSRREFLRASAAMGALSALAACGAAPQAAAPTAPAAAPTTAAAAPAAASSGDVITIVSSGAALPTDNVTFRWVDSGDQKAVFWKQFFPKYQEAHSNITIQYDALPWNEIAKVVPLGVQNGSAHDVFQLPLNISTAQAVSEGWLMALDDVIPDFANWKQNFPPGVLLEGITSFGGKTYGLPLTSNSRYGSLVLYNRAYMQAAGYDPENTPLTWDTFRDAAKKITAAGNGQYYGIIEGGAQTGRWAEAVRNLARMAGTSAGQGTPVTDDIDFRTGQYVLASDTYIAAVELLLAMKDDGSFFPGSLSLNAPQARAQMPQGVAGMILQGPWNIPIWQTENPDFDFGVSSNPVPNSGAPVPLTAPPGGANMVHVYAKSPYAAVAGDILHYMGTLEGQTAWAQYVGVADQALFPEAMQAVELDARAKKAIALFAEQMRVGPSPLVRNADITQVLLELKPLTPNFGDVIQGLFSGQITGVKQAMQDLQDRADAELERAIETARANGANVSRDDWVFTNWDPTKDFGEADYA